MGDDRDLKLPNGNHADVDISKLRDYCLNPEHEEGKHKARVFVSALGLTAADSEWLRDQLLHAAQNGDCEIGRESSFGKRYILDFFIRRDEKIVLLRSVWMIRTGENFPRLVTCYVL